MKLLLCIAALSASLALVPAARADDATTADLNTLDAIVNGKDHTTKVKPIMDRLAAVVDANKDTGAVKVALELAGRLAEFGKKQLATGKDLEWRAPRDADGLYRWLAAQFDGMQIGAEADTRLKDKDFLVALRAWEGYERLVAAEKKLKDVAGARRSAKDHKFEEVNHLQLETMHGLARSVQQSYPKSGAAVAAQHLLAKYEMTI